LFPSGSLRAATLAPRLGPRFHLESYPCSRELGVRQVHVRDEEADVVYAGRIPKQTEPALRRLRIRPPPPKQEELRVAGGHGDASLVLERFLETEPLVEGDGAGEVRDAYADVIDGLNLLRGHDDLRHDCRYLRAYSRTPQPHLAREANANFAPNL
jgi:hypothetical protein